jgi:hypothetical protein
MHDQDLLERIDELTHEVHDLQERATEDDGLDAGDEALLDGLRVDRDRMWDLLRQRRARRLAGLDPDAATVRDGRVVEAYLQ